MPIELKKIDASELIPIRHLVLRDGRPIETCIFEGDTLSSTIHFGLFFEHELIGVASLYSSKNKKLSNADQYQLRGMAILPKYQQKGFGRRLLEHCENQLKTQSNRLLWFHAREKAVPFYKKLGYTILGDFFIIESIGPHVVMYKNLSSE
ncbi:GNAT family N-acetyltransferase [Flavobacterium aciduliphilum]|uniref:Acetyltransferase (GNAT) family protein n=1 Tax=Flavobacterium aciduliphilum TaxID=1101402 RepID=A0A328YBY7_9FLAO|nr:GNAT family N-acetyltransferase [Flavobacterium aciduliphilum]RAR71449.1 acetyltransferase (GNAT) family protein [Flavobacterium aciduliphilum]